jgi:predicted nucleic acid-binding protein
VHLVIADTSPVNYLILIGHIDLLPRMFERVVLPTAVQGELSSPDAPPAVQQWIAVPPAWLEVVEMQDADPLAGLHKGEAAAIVLAQLLHADLVLIDERKGVNVARRKGLRVTGILGLLEMAAQRGLVNFVEAIERLRGTNFRSPEALLDLMLKRNNGKSSDD